MDPNKQPETKHFKSFWPILLIVLAAVIVGGLITLFAFNLSLEYDASSYSFSVQKHDLSTSTPSGMQKAEIKKK